MAADNGNDPAQPEMDEIEDEIEDDEDFPPIPPEEYEDVPYHELRMVELLFMEEDAEWRLTTFMPEYGEVKWKWYRRHRDGETNEWRPFYFLDVPRRIRRRFWSRIRKRLLFYREHLIGGAIIYANREMHRAGRDARDDDK